MKKKQICSNPVLLMGYGAYGHRMTPTFHSEYISLLERNWILAFAHVR